VYLVAVMFEGFLGSEQHPALRTERLDLIVLDVGHGRAGSWGPNGGRGKAVVAYGVPTRRAAGASGVPAAPEGLHEASGAHDAADICPTDGTEGAPGASANDRRRTPATPGVM
jgi:hypothetical protein